jgi:hypothetical protein
MGGEPQTTSLEELEGAIQSIDAPCREMVVLSDGKSHRFDIGGECSVWLHGERVKLRILQIADLVHITYSTQGDDLVAEQIRVLD